MMTEVSLNAPRLPFPVQAQQQGQQVDVNRATFPRHASHGNETFIPRGTPARDLANLFPAREP